MTKFKFSMREGKPEIIVLGCTFSICDNLCSDWFVKHPMEKLFGLGCPKFGIWINLYPVN